MSCIAPRCAAQKEPGSLFCRAHEQAPAAQRGGWLSAAKRRMRMMGPLNASQITNRLWIGGEPPLDRDLPDFDVLVLCAQEIQPQRMGFHGLIIRCPIIDHVLDTQMLGRVAATSKLLVTSLTNGKRVLVTCSMGLNRSALVAALVLTQMTTKSADEIIGMIRGRRDPHALFNKHFVDLIQHIAGPGRKSFRWA